MNYGVVIGSAVVSGMSAVVCLGTFRQDPPSSIKAQDIKVCDTEGRVMVHIGKSPSDGASGVFLYDKEGNRVGMYCLNKEGLPEVSLGTSDTEKIVTLKVNQGKTASMLFRSPESYPLLEIGTREIGQETVHTKPETPQKWGGYLWVRDRKGEPMVEYRRK